MLSIEDEISILKDNKILYETEDISDINHNAYSSKIWADAFWRRRKIHSNRYDPEIEVVLTHQPVKVLEIGSAYGRVTRKLIDSAIHTIEISGIEFNPNFEKYTKIYAEIYPSLNSVNFMYGDFMDFQTSSDGKFNLILLPMNTFPGFPTDKLSNLFDSVKNNLLVDGKFIFSTHKFPQNLDKYTEHSYGGELLVELKEGAIAGTFYRFPGYRTKNGYQSVSYSIYTRFDSAYIPKERVINRSISNFYLPEKLEEIVNNNGFEIHSIDISSHSDVYSLQIEK